MQALRLLERYNRKAEILNRRSFLAAIRQGKGTFGISSRAGEGAVVTYDLPNEEELHAFLLTARLFDQDRDGLSFRRMVELYQHLAVPEALRTEVVQIASDLDRYMAAKSTLVLNGHHLTRREIFDVLLYGGHAHANDDKEEAFKRWSADEVVRVLTEVEFIDILACWTQSVFWMRQVHLRAFDHLPGAAPPDAVEGGA
jgi:hypothetical protein